MRRADREITDRAAIEDIIARAQICHLGLCVGGEPYVVPVSFGVHAGYLYIHSAPEGRKIDVLRSNPRVCFEAVAEVGIIPADNACAWGCAYESVIGWGRAELLCDEEDKATGLNAIMQHYGGEAATYSSAALARVAIIRVKIESVTGKTTRPR